MAILTPDYERMQNGQTTDFDTTEEYRNYFQNQDIDSAQSLITSNNDYLVTDADKLNNLCDTIDYMQQIWDDDKTEFANKYLRLTKEPEVYDSSKTYNVGDLVSYNGTPYFCISDDTTGVWDNAKWIRIGNDDIGLDFLGSMGTGAEILAIRTYALPDSRVDHLEWVTWSTQESIGRTDYNIRYLADTDISRAYTGEIYITDWNGGEG